MLPSVIKWKKKENKVGELRPFENVPIYVSAQSLPEYTATEKITYKRF